MALSFARKKNKTRWNQPLKLVCTFFALICFLGAQLFHSQSIHVVGPFEMTADSPREELPFFLPTKNNRTDALPFHHPRNHPRVGARDENGSYGFVVDPYLVRRSMIHRMKESNYHKSIDGRWTSSLSLTSDEYHEICNKSVGEGYGEKTLNEVRFLRPVRVVPFVPPSAPKVLCVVYTHAGVSYRVSAITETWGWKCDGFFAASTITVRDPMQSGFGSIDLVHRGEEEYKNMWQKTRSILAYIYEHYLDEFHYYHICGDDVFMIPENLKKYLSDLETGLAPGIRAYRLIIGERVGTGNFRYIRGGAGYTLNREALRFYNEESGLMDDCYPEERVSAEDRYISRCFQRKNIWEFQPIHEISDMALVQGLSPESLLRYTRRQRKTSVENPYTMVPEDWIANETYAWHVMERNPATYTVSMKRYHAHFYQTCPEGSIRVRSMKSHAFLDEPVVVT